PEPIERCLDRRIRVALARQLAGQLTAGVPPTLKVAQPGAQRGLLIGGAVEPLQNRRGDRDPGCQVQLPGNIGGDGPSGLPARDDSDRTGSPRVRLQTVDDHSSSASGSGTPGPAAARIPRPSLTLCSTSASRAGLSLRKSLAFSRPCPIRWSP